MAKKKKDTHVTEINEMMIPTASPSKTDRGDLDALQISDELRAELRRAGLFTVNHTMELTSEEIERYGSSLMYEQYLGLIAAVRIYLRENGKEGGIPQGVSQGF